jgi:hypothetical protein
MKTEECAGPDNSTKEQTDNTREVSPYGHDYSGPQCD